MKRKKFFVNVWLILFFHGFTSTILFSQQTYDNCNNALEICPNVLFNVNNLDATKTFCANCDDNFTFCFTANNTIWLKFITNSSGGSTQIDFSNLVFENGVNQDTEIQATILKALAPCDASTYTAVGNCISNATGSFSLNANLLPSTLYYVVINGAKNGAGITSPAEVTMDLILSGNGVNRIVPSIAIFGPDSLCLNEVATFSVASNNCPDSTGFQWFINGNLIATTTDPVFQTSAIKHNDIVSVSNSCFIQCPLIQMDFSPLIYVETFLVDAGEDKFISPNESAILNGNTSALLYVWTPNSTISNTLLINPAVNPPITTSYFLTAEQNGCFISDEVVVYVDLKLGFTNTFTPNDDGYNDTWEIPSLINYPNCLVQIFDRWGQLVFTTTGYNEKKAWDGKINGKAANETVFFYTIDLRNGDDDLIKGSLTIIR